MNQELIRDELHRTVGRVIEQAEEETLTFMIKQCEMVLSELSVAKGEEQPSVMRRKLSGARNGVPMIFSHSLQE